MSVNTARLVETFQALVSIDAPTRQERGMADELIRRLSVLGIPVQEDSAALALGGNAGNLIARVPGDLDLPPILFSSHMDTVEPSRGKRALLHGDGRITSAGDTVLGADDVGGLTAILEALTVLQEYAIPHRPLELLFPAAEEDYTAGSKQLPAGIFQSREAYVLDMDGPVGQAALEAPTIIYFRADFQGKAAHAGMAPEDGIHAIAAAASAVSALAQGHVDSQTTVNIGTIQGGAATNIVPERCTLEGEVRGFDHGLALARMETIRKGFQAAAARHEARVHVTTEVRTVAYSEPADSPAVARFRRACQAVDLEPALSKTFGGSDNNTLQQRGIHGIVLASAMHAVHSTGEYTTVEELRKLAELTLALMTDQA